MLTIYPALFLKAVDDVGYTVIFPDLEECVTEGDTKEEAFTMATDALGLYLYGLEAPPKPGKLRAPQSSDNEEGDFDLDRSFSSYVSVDMLEVEKTVKAKTVRKVRKNVSIPSWLNQRALAENINFSQTLQDALMERLRV